MGNDSRVCREVVDVSRRISKWLYRQPAVGEESITGGEWCHVLLTSSHKVGRRATVRALQTSAEGDLGVAHGPTNGAFDERPTLRQASAHPQKEYTT